MKKITTLIIMLSICISLNVKAQSKETLEMQKKVMATEKESDKKIAIMNSIIRDFQLDTVKNAEVIDIMKGEIALSYLNTGTFTKFEIYIGMIKNKFNQTSFMNMGADMLLKNESHPDYTEALAKRTIERYEAYKDDPTTRPAAFLLSDWDRFMKMAAYPYYESYARILHINGKDKMAFIYQEKAIKGHELEDLMPSSTELYAVLLESVGRDDQAYELLLKMAKTGKSNLAMNTQLKQLFVKRKGTEADASIFLDSIQRNIRQTWKSEIAKKMIQNQSAPDFNLLDLNGKRMNLSELRGKVIVIDFWATWCAPCIATMPAMKKLYDLHPEVMFLFVATGESGTAAAAKARVSTYIKENKFPVNVLMDNYIEGTKSFQAATAYRLKGIPTKIVVDKQGMFRFSTEGYTTDNEVINELEAMIAIAKEQ
ncbi:TlpA disulfide reductase family protein [Pedobacter antarcticus]|uniref:TlpA family protein disulfide reductase n=1 Tax=Pedobacter antarcticus TaxID=34086 RepID=UPI00292EF9CB|nr:TlpA disulfide reductase family protein [Pedobacter antarcticus]